MNLIIETKNLSVSYGQTEALTNVSFTVEKGDFVGLAGPNGAGKTTLIKTILGLLPTSKGEIKLFGKTKEKFNDWGKIGYLPQKLSTINTLFPATVDEVVTLGLLSQKKFPRRITANDQKRTSETLRELGIFDLKKRMLSELSGGQQQKVLLARALVSNPEILIFDEPSTALDPESRESFFQLIQKLNKKNGTAVILITHDTGYIGQYANKLLYIDKSLVYFGKFSDFCQDEKMNAYFGKYEQHIICHQHN
ncbi:MAG: ABC transporter ATP-binding protein [Candidatus Moranbacteria bacterium CG_4_8_14_3_um_filter_34_16]|nr:MAG: ABC transporter ATP-binding protein [Candidatus Moranbacteria bacterium CG08_land_8_20_14_0_20_34_16]PIW95210.1 MAG: ABC transporter ATP-binding protein [Candidatus Moranbacteria bacterium CG_4_8_14_3_um_filter_34_16]